MSNGCQLVPVYHVLHRQSMSADKPYNELKKKRSGKGKQRADPDEEEAEAAAMNDMDGLLEGRKEVAYLRGLMGELHADTILTPAKALEKEQAELSAEAQRKEAEEDLARRRAAAVERGDGVECGCCFDTESPVSLTEEAANNRMTLSLAPRATPSVTLVYDYTRRPSSGTRSPYVSSKL